MPRHASPDSDSILDTDDEVNEFEQGGSGDEGGVAQWEPDAWDEGDEDDSSDEVGCPHCFRSFQDALTKGTVAVGMHSRQVFQAYPFPR